MSFDLPKLKYSSESMPDFMSKETFEFHYGKHHRNYINKLNELIKDTEFERLPIEEIIKKSKEKENTGLYLNAAQHWNHDFFWKCITPEKGTSPSTEVKSLIEKEFNDIQSFQDQFSQTALTLFGSGWAWLCLNENKKLCIIKTQNADNPLLENKKPLLTLDVWEHAYYIDFRNQRGEFIKKFWEHVDWNFINQKIN